MLTLYVETIARRDLPALLSPDESTWDSLRSARRKELLKMVIDEADPEWLTFREVSLLAVLVSGLRGLQDAGTIVDAVRRKWDFENDQPKPRE